VTSSGIAVEPNT